MAGSPTVNAPGPALGLCDGAGAEDVVALEVQPMVEVPSGTSGPWLVPAAAVPGATRRRALAALEMARAEGVHRGTAPDGGAWSWRLLNARIRCPGGAEYTLCPVTVCWLDADGEPAFDCDHHGGPDADLVAAGNRIGAFRFVAEADERPAR